MKTTIQTLSNESDNTPLMDEIKAMRERYRLLPFNLVLDQLLTETVISREAYDFIRKRGIWSEFLVFRSSH